MIQAFKRVTVWVPLIIAAALALGIWLGSLLFGGRNNHEGDAYGKIQTILDYVDRDYIDAVDTDSLLEAAIPELLSQLDPHTAYIPAEDLKAANDELRGSFSGIGITFNMLTDTITVVEVLSGGPSEKVGLLAGDRIITIDDSIVSGKNWSQEKVVNTLRGPEDTKVKLGVKRDNADKMLTFTVTRGEIPMTSIDAAYMIDDETGYVKVNKFSETTYDEFLNAMAQLRYDGAKKYILDLRSNGGGMMDAAIRMANEFLSSGDVIVSTKGRKEEMNAVSRANGLGSFQKEDLTVLIDEYSASASEILAGAIQDNDRGLIIGRRSFGKGLVQQQIDLPDHSAIRLTVARYYTPSGRCIQKSYSPGSTDEYINEIAERYNHGEGFNADSILIDRSQIFHTVGGREVFGGGGIIPDIYVPNDTAGISKYYISVFNAGLLHKYSFKYIDSNRHRLEQALDVPELLSMLPPDDQLLNDFVNYAHREGKIAPRWYYINISRNLILDILKSMIARDIFGTSAYYEVINDTDISVQRAVSETREGHAAKPVRE
jgi:peptidase, S41 family